MTPAVQESGKNLASMRFSQCRCALAILKGGAKYLQAPAKLWFDPRATGNFVQ